MLSFKLLSTVKLGVKSLLLHKLRSALTMLGIIFGVCSVIAMLAIGEGTSHEAQEAIKRLGSLNVIVRSLKPPEDTKSSGLGRSMLLDYGLSYKDGARLQAIPGVRRVLPKRIIRENARFGRNEIACQVLGTLPFYAEVVGAEVVRGRFLSQLDELHQNNVCVITVGLAQRLFPYQDPLEHSVKLDAFYYQVVGLLQERATDEQRAQTGSMEGEPLDNNVYIPLSTSRTRFGEIIMRQSAGRMEIERVELHEITIQMQDIESVETADPQIKTALDRFHDQNDYEVIVPLELLREAEEVKKRFNRLLGSIAAISLLVGGIGIMNIMLATVTERTREIGVRRALGAKKRDIITQFLVETCVLSIGGGVIGVVVGVMSPFVVAQLTEIRPIITLPSVFLAFGISAAVGIVFGIYPASTASKLDPIEALRHE